MATELDFARIAAQCRALADETRVRIAGLLSGGELCACELQPFFSLSQPTLSHHLAILVDAGILAARRQGKWTYYRLGEDAARSLAGFAEALASGDAATLFSAAARAGSCCCGCAAPQKEQDDEDE